MLRPLLMHRARGLCGPLFHKAANLKSHLVHGTGNFIAQGDVVVPPEPSPDPWTFFDPTGSCTYTRTGTHGQIVSPVTGIFEYWSGASRKTCPRLRQVSLDHFSDFDVEIAFSFDNLTDPGKGMGFMLEENDTKALIFIAYSNGSGGIDTRFVGIDGDLDTTWGLNSGDPIVNRMEFRMVRTGTVLDMYMKNASDAWELKFTRDVPFYLMKTISTYFKSENIAYTQSIDYFRVNNAGTTGFVSDEFN